MSKSCRYAVNCRTPGIGPFNVNRLFVDVHLHRSANCPTSTTHLSVYRLPWQQRRVTRVDPEESPGRIREVGGQWESDLTAVQHSLKFVKNLEEHYVCPTCKGVVLNPHQTGCGHIFCYRCIQGLPEISPWARINKSVVWFFFKQLLQTSANFSHHKIGNGN
uniref:TNF receptor-associated factor 5 n=1 Tax=Salmo salar TaxID=8030 RepID=B5X9W6_SALSA|nr:TNF receptor-associated factor 5 [Salmo salar]